MSAEPMTPEELAAIKSRARRVGLALSLERTTHVSWCDAVRHSACHMVPDDPENLGSIAGEWWCNHYVGKDCRDAIRRQCGCGAELGAAKVALATVDVPALVAEVERLRAALAFEKHDHEMTREHHDASMRAILEALGEEVDPEDTEATRAKWVSLAASTMRKERDEARAQSAYLAPRQRAGQRIFNAVHAIDPAFADSVRATDVDPFQDDKRCEAFLRAWITTERDVRDRLLAVARRVVEAIAQDNAAAEAHREAHNALVAQHVAGATVEALEPLALHHVRAEVLCRDTARAVRAALEALASEVKEGPRA